MFCFNAISNEQNSIMLIKLKFVGSNGSKTNASIVLFNEKNQETFTISKMLSRKAGVMKIKLAAGIYSIHKYKTSGGIKLRMTDYGYRFEIVDNQINYVGDWVFTENWGDFVSKKGEFSVGLSTTFEKETIEQGFQKYPDMFANLEFNVSEAIALE